MSLGTQTWRIETPTLKILETLQQDFLCAEGLNFRELNIGPGQVSSLDPPEP